MAGNGGKRPGAGAKKGSTQKIPRALIAKELGPRILEVLSEMLYGDNKDDKKWAVQVSLPYAIQKQPQAVDVTSAGEALGFSLTSLVRDAFGIPETPPLPVAAKVDTGSEPVEAGSQGKADGV